MAMQDNQLVPIPGLDRGLDRPLSDLVQSKPYGVTANDPATVKDYLFIVLKRKWLILSLVLVVTSLVAIQSFRTPSIYEGETIIKIQHKLRLKVLTSGIRLLWNKRLCTIRKQEHIFSKKRSETD